MPDPKDAPAPFNALTASPEDVDRQFRDLMNIEGRRRADRTNAAFVERLAAKIAEEDRRASDGRRK